jgi:hypothetical protein
LLIACGCNKEEKAVISNNPKAPVLQPHASIEITKENRNETVTFKWTKADFGYPAAITYKLLGKVGLYGQTDIIGVSQADSLTIELDALNNQFLSMGATAGIQNQIMLSVQAMVTSDTAYPSAVSDIKIVFINLYVSCPQGLHLVGDMFDNAAGYPNNDYWNISNYKYIMFRDSNLAPNIYTSCYRANASFQLFLTGNLGSWTNPGYGYAGEGKIVTPAPAYGNIAMNNADSGYYTLTVDLTNLTYSVAPYNESGTTVHSTMFIRGDFNGWANENMIRSHYDSHIWIIDDIVLNEGGGVKFHADEGWAVNWGADNFPYGRGVSGGANIIVDEAGSYFIKFNDLTGHYVFHKK